MRARFLGLGLMLVALAGCSTSFGKFFTSPPTSQTQQDVIAGAVVVAVPACRQLATGLKPSEVIALRTSLEFVMSTVERDSAGAQKAVTELMTAHVPAAPYAPVVAAVVQIGVNQVPAEVQASTYGSVARAVISGCLAGLGDGGAA